MMPNLLVVDDDAGIRSLLAESLTRHGFDVRTAANAREMDEAMRHQAFDLLLLDVMMPGEDGLSISRRLSQAGGPPIVMLSALGDEHDRIVGLEVGASHYLPKPCSPREIVAVVRAALRQRVAAQPDPGRLVLGFEGWQVDMAAHEVRRPDGAIVDLTDGEFAVLRIFLERPHRVLTRDTLLDAARGPDSEAFDRAIDVQVSRLRRKLQSPGDSLIRTVRNEGYMFLPQVQTLRR